MQKTKTKTNKKFMYENFNIPLIPLMIKIGIFKKTKIGTNLNSTLKYIFIVTLMVNAPLTRIIIKVNLETAILIGSGKSPPFLTFLEQKKETWKLEGNLLLFFISQTYLQHNK